MLPSPFRERLQPTEYSGLQIFHPKSAPNFTSFECIPHVYHKTPRLFYTQNLTFPSPTTLVTRKLMMNILIKNKLQSSLSFSYEFGIFSTTLMMQSLSVISWGRLDSINFLLYSSSSPISCSNNSGTDSYNNSLLIGKLFWTW